MTLTTDVQTLVTRGVYYARQYETWELAWHGFLDMTFGARRDKINPYTDWSYALRLIILY